MVGDYSYEEIQLDDSKSRLLDPNKTVSEQQRVATLVAPVTQYRYWDGVFQLPTAGVVNSQFGARRSFNGRPYDSYHGGVDFSSSEGALISSPAAGQVVLAETLEVRGNTTIVDHGWGVYSAYLHQSKILVDTGDVVARGQIMGHVGSTGLVTGPHLHWEMYAGNVQIDPMQWTKSSLP